MTRDDLELLDTPSLRALARQHLPRRAKSLRTRAALLSALIKKLVAVQLAKPRPKRASRTSSAVGQLPTLAALLPQAAPAPSTGGPAATARSGVPAPAPLPAVEEGFFILHARERRGRRRPPPRAAALSTAKGTERPLPVGEEVPQLLVRDPTTLFLFWDFRKDLERGAAFGLKAPHLLFRLFEGQTLVRAVEAPLGRRSLYLEGLQPGHSYSVEAFLASSDGHVRPTGRRSAPLRLPPAAPSQRLEVEVVRVPWEEPLPLGATGAAGARVAGQAVAAPSRLNLPASLDWRGGPGPGGPRSGRP